MLLLNIGGEKGKTKGPYKKWVTVDIRETADVVIDIMESLLPFSDKTVDAIYSSHTLEHIFPDKLDFVLSECYRVLKPNAPIRIVVPDIDKAITAYVNKDNSFLNAKGNPGKMGWLPNFPLCFLSSWFFTYKIDKNKHQRIVGGHVNVFNKELLTYYLDQAKFKNIVQKKYKDCNSVFKNCDFDRYKNCSLYMEAST